MRDPIYKSRPDGFQILPACAPEAERVAEFIHCSPGLSNSYCISTSEGRVIVNTGMGFESIVHKRNFDAVDPGPTRYILLTQGHVDHVGGVDLFKEEGTEVVAQAGNQWYQREDGMLRDARAMRSYFAFAGAIQSQQKHVRQIAGPVPAQSVPAPTITFEDRYDFSLGDLRFELHAVPGGETVESMVVWLPDHEILLSGNVVGALFGHIPNLVTIRGDRYRDALQVIETIDRVIALEPKLILYGRHAPIEGKARIREELEAIKGAVRFVHDRTVEYMVAGKDVFTAMREIELPPELEVGQGYGKVDWDVRAIWENYMGWFHQRSTTELYPVPPESVYPDLVELAGGPDVVAARAREKLDAGQAVEAIHLVEAALSVAPGHTSAIRVGIDAHRALDAKSENFWLSAWLRHQAERLEKSLGDRQ